MLQNVLQKAPPFREVSFTNPPFTNGQDIEHILQARTFLRPGGKLVALCANGSKQAKRLRPLAATWEELPEGTFAGEGTNVNVVILTMLGKAEK